MSDETNPTPDFTPPPREELPQGAQAFLEAHSASYQAVGELFAPYMQQPGIARNFDQVMIKLREVGFWVQEALTMITRPELFRAPEEGAGDGAPAEE